MLVVLPLVMLLVLRLMKLLLLLMTLVLLLLLMLMMLMLPMFLMMLVSVAWSMKDRSDVNLQPSRWWPLLSRAALRRFHVLRNQQKERRAHVDKLLH